MLFQLLFFFFVFTVLVQITYWGAIFGKLAFYNPKKLSKKRIAVSVIICARNESENLQKHLPSIVEQDYPEFEIVLINDGSTDDTLKIMHTFKDDNYNVKVVDVRQNDRFLGHKKYALTLGIKAAANEFLLFTDADCKVNSNDWINIMTRNYSNQHSIVLGYGGYRKIKNSFLNKLIRFETLLTAVQYMSFSILGKTYMGVGRNLAYRKSLFIENNGFSEHIHLASGDDDLFINSVATSRNTAICIDKDSFTISEPKTRFINWINQKRRHVTTATQYKKYHKFVLALFFLSQLSFYLIGFILILFSFYIKIVLALILIRYAIQATVLYKSAKKLNELDLITFIPFLEISLIASQFSIFMINLISKPKTWN